MKIDFFLIIKMTVRISFVVVLLTIVAFCAGSIVVDDFSNFDTVPNGSWLDLSFPRVDPLGSTTIVCNDGSWSKINGDLIANSTRFTMLRNGHMNLARFNTTFYQIPDDSEVCVRSKISCERFKDKPNKVPFDNVGKHDIRTGFGGFSLTDLIFTGGSPAIYCAGNAIYGATSVLDVTGAGGSFTDVTLLKKRPNKFHKANVYEVCISNSGNYARWLIDGRERYRKYSPSVRETYVKKHRLIEGGGKEGIPTQSMFAIILQNGAFQDGVLVPWKSNTPQAWRQVEVTNQYTGLNGDIPMTYSNPDPLGPYNLIFGQGIITKFGAMEIETRPQV